MFTWRPIYAEIVEHLQQYQFGNAELVDLFVRMHRNELKVSSFLDRDATGKQFQLEEMDPFAPHMRHFRSATSVFVTSSNFKPTQRG